MGRLKASSATATPTTRTTSSRAPLPKRSATIATQIAAPASGFLAGVHVYLGPHPRRALALDLLPIQQTGRRPFCGPWLSAAQTGVLSPSRRLLPAKPGHHRDHWHVLRLWRCVAPPPPRVATSLPLAARRPSTWPTMIMTGMSATSTASPRTYTHQKQVFPVFCTL